MAERWTWLNGWTGAAAGVALGVGDTALLLLMDGRVDLGGSDATLLIMGGYAATFAVLGWAIGSLTETRRALNGERATIQTQLKQLEESQDKLVEAERLAALGRMAAGVAHEVRNPLGVIRSSAAILEEDLPDGDSDSAKACRFIIEEVDRLDGFVGRVLDFSRPMTAHSEPVNLKELVERAAMAAQARSGDVHVTVHGDPEILADRDLLEGALLSLVVNAAESGASRVDVSAVQDGADTWITVVDDGEGVSEEVRPRLFQPFFTTKARGTGLGLAMARRAVAAHGGAMVLDPSDQGARFRITLPSGVR